MRVDDFDFDLPEALIALRPARPRDSARLLQIRRGDRNTPPPPPPSLSPSPSPSPSPLDSFECAPGVQDTPSGLTDGMFRDILHLLRAGDVLVLNETKVLPAQLTGRRAARADGGGEAVSIDVTLHKKCASSKTDQIWTAFIRPAKRLREGDEIDFAEGFKATVLTRKDAEARLHFPGDSAVFDKGLTLYGAPPLPPYIGRKRAIDAADRADYQTVFAKAPGSVAAPTAGLHFTNALLREVEEKGVRIETVTLHVGAGTFLPVQCEDTNDHPMHSEWGEISAPVAQRLNAARQAGGRIIAVGTTSLRLLESAAARDGIIRPFKGETDIFITPGFKFNAVDALITNFHLPRSTLFMLVCAFAGYEQMRAAYRHAIAEKYRFYSYGDACYLIRHDR